MGRGDSELRLRQYHLAFAPSSKPVTSNHHQVLDQPVRQTVRWVHLGRFFDPDWTVLTSTSVAHGT